jgi:hypothetical protein
MTKRNVAAPPAVVGAALPSGTWILGPVTLAWSLQDLDEIDLTVSVLGVTVDTLAGTLSKTQTEIADQINVFDLVKGSLSLTAKYDTTDGTNGLYLAGQLTGPGFDTGVLSVKIISW